MWGKLRRGLPGAGGVKRGVGFEEGSWTFYGRGGGARCGSGGVFKGAF